jgi:hypothetical protein
MRQKVRGCLNNLKEMLLILHLSQAVVVVVALVIAVIVSPLIMMREEIKECKLMKWVAVHNSLFIVNNNKMIISIDFL